MSGRLSNAGTTSRWPVIVGAGAAVAVGASIARVPGAAAFLGTLGAVLMLLGLGWFCCRPIEPRLRRWTAAWTSVSFVVHLTIGLTISASTNLTDYLGPDARGYDRIGWEIARHWQDGYPMPSLPPGKEGFYYLLAGLYHVLGHHLVAGLVVNAACAAALVVLTTDTTTRLFGASASRPVAPFAVLLPSLLVWPSQLLREATILFLIALATNLAVRLSAQLRLLTILSLAVVLALLFTSRSNVAALLTLGLVAGLVLARRDVASGIGVATGLGAAVAAVVLVVGVGYTGYRFSSEADLEDVQRFRTGLATTAESGFGESVDATSPGELVRHLPEAALLFMVGPFPWQIRSSQQIPLLVDTIVVLALVPSFARGLRAGRRVGGRRTLVLLVPAMLLLVMLSLLIANFGTVARERPQVVILLLPFVAYGWTLRPAARRRHDRAQASVRARDHAPV